jgi:hypothetical protein
MNCKTSSASIPNANSSSFTPNIFKCSSVDISDNSSAVNVALWGDRRGKGVGFVNACAVERRRSDDIDFIVVFLNGLRVRLFVVVAVGVLLVVS